VLAASGPTDCFDTVIEAWRIATRLMTPVVVLSDAFIANGAEPWRIPDAAGLNPIAVAHPVAGDGTEPFRPYARDEWLARPWALPGTPGLMHRVGSLEKQDLTGNVSYDPDNHEHMVKLRARKVANAVNLVPNLEVSGPENGSLLVLSWGGTFGACRQAVEQVRARGDAVAHAHLRHLNPLPANTGEVLERYGQVLVPELNLGQLAMMLRARYLVDVVSLGKVRGRPFWVRDIVEAIEEILA
jgi:2-oxoglutarate ferredoxin oxidoreductase subunit alpha